NFTIHCKSKDDDVGSHVIPVGKSYDLSFRVNFTGTTLFFCSITSPEGSIDFDLYNAKRDMLRCPTQCNWTAAKAGLVADYEEKFVISPFKTHVNVLNRLNGDVIIHCKSKDDDVGSHLIHVGQSYDLNFRVNFIGTTLFFCSIISTEGSIDFDLYNAKRDMWRCPTQCDWIATKKG
ncbi:Self-incomp_S1 domain-containing protein, partial [Cephalotus follicularis]